MGKPGLCIRHGFNRSASPGLYTLVDLSESQRRSGASQHSASRSNLRPLCCPSLPLPGNELPKPGPLRSDRSSQRDPLQIRRFGQCDCDRWDCPRSLDRWFGIQANSAISRRIIHAVPHNCPDWLQRDPLQCLGRGAHDAPRLLLQRYRSLPGGGCVLACHLGLSPGIRRTQSRFHLCHLTGHHHPLPHRLCPSPRGSFRVPPRSPSIAIWSAGVGHSGRRRG